MRQLPTLSFNPFSWEEKALPEKEHIIILEKALQARTSFLLYSICTQMLVPERRTY